MLYPLHEYISGLNVIRYISFRSGAAAVTALLISFIIGPTIIRYLERKGLRETIRDDGPESHKVKEGTPTAGGIIILLAVLSGTFLFARWDYPQVWLVFGATLWAGVVGLLDDWLKMKDKAGLAARYKLIGQLSLGLVVGVVLYYYPEIFSRQFAEHRTESTVPFFKNLALNFSFFGTGILFILMTMVVITGTSNACNIADGLDGLSIGLSGILAVGIAILSYISGHVNFANYLNIFYLPGSGEVAVYCSALVGASLGFLYWNAHPAQVFMGDSGSLGIGAGIGTAAILIKKELFLLMLGGVLVFEVLTVLIQRYYFKYTRIRYGKGVRVFKIAPFHHHLEKCGWPESRIVIRMWIAAILLLFLTLTSFKVR